MKQRLRNQFREIRDNLNVQNASIRLRENFLSNVTLEAGLKIASYYPINSEIDLSLLNASLIDEGFEIFLPCRDLKFRAWKPDSQMQNGLFPEPAGTMEIITEEIDIFLIPLLAFDTERNRLGYGAGYYDKILENANGKKIGIAYEAQKAEKLPAEKHDIKLDMIVTEVNIYK